MCFLRQKVVMLRVPIPILVFPIPILGKIIPILRNAYPYFVFSLCGIPEFLFAGVWQKQKEEACCSYMPPFAGYAGIKVVPCMPLWPFLQFSQLLREEKVILLPMRSGDRHR